jgi:hypothetical protein
MAQCDDCRQSLNGSSEKIRWLFIKIVAIEQNIQSVLYKDRGKQSKINT